VKESLSKESLTERMWNNKTSTIGRGGGHACGGFRFFEFVKGTVKKPSDTGRRNLRSESPEGGGEKDKC